MASRYLLVITPEAIDELQLAINYYNKQHKGLGKRLYSDLKRQLTIIKTNPEVKSIRYDDVRFALADHFPYAIHYTLDSERRVIIVHAILSDYRDPDTSWK